jgi:hypothetical protein
MTVPVNYRLCMAGVGGTWDPGSVPAITPESYAEAQYAASVALNGVITVPGNELGFHIISTDYPGGPVMRTRWKLETYIYGPSLLLNTTEPHDSQLTMSTLLYPLSEQRQCVFDEAYPDMRFRGVFSTVVGALLLRHAWGDGPRTLTLNGFGSGTFTPTSLRFGDANDRNAMEVAYDGADKDIVAYPFVQGQNDRPPALWLVTEDQSAAWQISYCIAEPGHPSSERWDTDEQAVPSFTPLDWPVS